MSYKQLVMQQIANAHFPFGYRAITEEKILYVLQTLRRHAITSERLYCPKNRKAIGTHPPRLKAGRPTNTNEATYLISALNMVWMQAFGKKPRLNRRGHHQTPFVVFAEPIMACVGIHNALDNLNKHRRYVNRISRIIDRRHSLVIKAAKK